MRVKITFNAFFKNVVLPQETVQSHARCTMICTKKEERIVEQEGKAIIEIKGRETEGMNEWRKVIEEKETL